MAPHGLLPHAPEPAAAHQTNTNESSSYFTVLLFLECLLDYYVIPDRQNILSAVINIL